MLFQINYLVIGLGLIVMAILLFRHQGPRHPKLMLFILVGIFVAILIHVSLLLNGMILEVPHLYRFSSPLSYAGGAFAYFYVRSVLYQEKSLRPIDGLHALPPALHFVELIPFYLQSADAKRALLSSMVADPEQFTQTNEGILPPYLHIMLKALLLAGYMAFTLWMLWNYRSRISNALRPIRQPRAVRSWLAIFAGSLLLMGLGVLAAPLLGQWTPVNSQTLIYFFVGCLFLAILLTLFFRPVVLYGIPLRREPEPESIPTPAQARSSLLDEDQLQANKSRLLTIMERERPFLNKNLTLNMLAEQVDIPRHLLSATINEGFGVNFNEFVNRYRISYICEEVKPELWDRLSVEGLADEAGFNSRFTFSKAFKKETGMTPSAFRKALA